MTEIDKLEKCGPVTPTGPRAPDLEVVIIGAGPRAGCPAGSCWLPDRLASVKIGTRRFVRSADSVGGHVVLKLGDNSERRVDPVFGRGRVRI